MNETNIALVRHEVDNFLQRDRFMDAAEAVETNLSKSEPAFRELIIRIHREAVKAKADDDAERIRVTHGDLLTGPLSDFLEKVDPNDPSIINL